MAAWTGLLREAIGLLAGLAANGRWRGQWTVGGGTILAIRYAHRLSKDIDIFLADPQVLTYLSPRLNDRAEALVNGYTEQSSSLKLSLPQGDIDFIVAPSLLGLPSVPLAQITDTALPADIQAVLTDQPAEILAKKILYRGASLKDRDILDLAVVLRADPEAQGVLAGVLGGRRDSLRRWLSARLPGFAARARQDLHLLPAGEALLDRVGDIVAGVIGQSPESRSP